MVLISASLASARHQFTLPDQKYGNSTSGGVYAQLSLALAALQLPTEVRPGLSWPRTLDYIPRQYTW